MAGALERSLIAAHTHDVSISAACADAFAQFRITQPGRAAAYVASARLDHLRAEEYRRVDATGQIYLDWAGAALYADRQVREHHDLLRRSLLGNPHSPSPASLEATELVRRARARVLAHFNASPEEYAVIFTPNASAALKLVGEAYPFAPGGRLLLTSDNHNSVNGIREFARQKGAWHGYAPLAPDLRLAPEPLRAALAGREFCRAGGRAGGPHGRGDGARLFAYPAQSNFSGVKHSLGWIDEAQAHGWDVLLDASALVPTSPLDLDRHRPDFVTLSFYKMMGYPTGIGCLLARRAALARLSRPWFAGGSVFAASVLADAHRLANDETGFEDGTVDFLGIPAVEIGLRYLQEIGIDVIQRRVEALTAWLLEALAALHHPNGRPLVRIYGPTTMDERGGTIACNFLDRNGRIIDERIVEQLASQSGVSLRTGCFCNPGAAESAFAIDSRAADWVFAPGRLLSFDDTLTHLGMPNGGAIRLSLGVISSFADVYRFVAIVSSLLGAIGTQAFRPREHC